MWKKIVIKEDRDWIEFHKETMHIKYGAVLLKIWICLGIFQASLTDVEGNKKRTSLMTDDATKAKQKATNWARSI